MFAIRDLKHEDAGFVLTTWVNGYFYGNKDFKICSIADQHAVLKPAIQIIAQNSNYRMLVLAEDPNVIIGYIAYAKDTLHWIYLKKAWRNQKLTKKLLENLPLLYYSFRTKSSSVLKGLKYYPLRKGLL